MANAKIDDNREKTLMGVTNDSNATPTNLIVSSTSKRLLVSAIISSQLDDLSDVNITSGTTGDIIYRDASSEWVNLPIGGEGQALQVTSGIPAWGSAGVGNVVGASTSTNLGIPVFNGTTGKTIQSSQITITGTSTMAGAFISGTTSTLHVRLTNDVKGILPLANGGLGQSLADPGADRIIFWDDSESKTDFLAVAGTGLAIFGTELFVKVGDLDHDSLSGFVSNEHIDHTGVTLTAGAGLTGGGDISANRTFDVVAGTGIVVTADAVAIDPTSVALVSSSQTLVNKTINGNSNTLTVLAASQLSGTVPLANGGLAAVMADPNADRGLLWDDSEGRIEWLAYGTAMAITGTTVGLNVGTASAINGGTTLQVGITPLTFSTSNYGIRPVGVLVVDPNTDVTTGSAKAGFRIPSVMNGWNLVGVAANVFTNGTTNTTNIQLRRVRSGATSVVLSTRMTIDSGEVDTSTAAAPGVIDTGQDDVNTGDQYLIDVDAVTTTAPKGLFVEMQFRNNT